MSGPITGWRPGPWGADSCPQSPTAGFQWLHLNSSSSEEVGKLMSHLAVLPTSLRNGVRSGVDALMVKLRILISMVQVMTQLGIVYSIPYPEAYTKLLRWVSLLELNIIDVAPLQCIFPWVNFIHRLVLRTAVPWVLIGLLLITAKHGPPRFGNRSMWFGNIWRIAFCA